MRGIVLLVVTLVLAARLSHALSAADLYAAVPPPPPPATLSGQLLHDDTEVLTPHGIYSEQTFNTTIAPAQAQDDTSPSGIEPAAGPADEASPTTGQP
ncbi:MAG: hypothetical protein GC129_07360 [Proteobacteria bacterium]|nr:hypothetical protein [Pseudomonadota bacterium]